MTEPALTKIRSLEMHWLGRLPATFGLCNQLKDAAFRQPEDWVDIGAPAKRRVTSATYRAQTLDTTLYGQPVRAFLYVSVKYSPPVRHRRETLSSS